MAVCVCECDCVCVCERESLCVCVCECECVCVSLLSMGDTFSEMKWPLCSFVYFKPSGKHTHRYTEENTDLLCTQTDV